jgi:hypothetical protein
MTTEMIGWCERNDFEPANVPDIAKLRENENPAALANAFVADIDAELENSGDLNVKGHPAGNFVPAAKSAASGTMIPFPVHRQKLANADDNQGYKGNMSKMALTNQKDEG